MIRWIPCLLAYFFAFYAALPAEAQQSRPSRPISMKPPRKNAGAPAPPAPEVGKAPLLTRYWLLADSIERVESAAVFTHYINHFIQCPAIALQSGIMATIHALISVLPDGRVGSVAITRRDLSTDSPPMKAVLALDAELQRMALQLRFKPAALRMDSTSTSSNSNIIDVTDITTGADQAEGLIVTDVNDNSITRIQPDTVTISHRFTLTPR